MSNRKLKEELRKSSENYPFRDVFEVLAEDNLEKVVREEDSEFLFIPFNVSQYPKKPSEVDPIFPGMNYYLKTSNPEFKGLAEYVAENKKVKEYFMELAKNFSHNYSSTFELYSELRNNHYENASKKDRNLYGEEVIVKDSLEKVTTEFVRKYKPDKNNEQGIVLRRDSLEKSKEP